MLSRPSIGSDLNRFINARFGTHLKHLIYRTEITQFRALLHKHKLSMSVSDALSTRGFRAVSLALHPDKPGGSAEDFVFAQNLKEKWTQDIDLKSMMDSQIQIWQPRLHKATIASKTVDIALEAVRLYHMPKLSSPL